MPKRRLTAKRVPAPPAHAESNLPAPLPLQAAAPASLSPSKPPRDKTVLPSNSLVRQKVLAIIAMRLEGKTNEEIAAKLGIKEATIRQYMFLAGRNGWLSKKAVDPTDRLEYEIAHKVVRNLDEMLDSDDEARRDLATLKTADGMLFKRFAEAASQQPALAVIGLRIEMPAGVNTAVREGTTGGTPRWTEGEVIDVAPKG